MAEGGKLPPLVTKGARTVHNGNGQGQGHGHGHGNGKRWLLIGLLVLGGFWLVNDSYRDGYTDALIQTGQTVNVRQFRDSGPDFPWGPVILAGIGFVAWRKGAFDRFGVPGGPFAGGRGSPSFRGPRAYFDEWHRESHEAERRQYVASVVPPAPPAPAPQTSPPPSTEASGNGVPQTGYAATPPPPPPAPEYWAAMARAAEAAGNTGVSGESSGPAPDSPAASSTPVG